MSTSSYWVSENGSPSESRDNVFYERVRTYSPITKAVHVLDNSPTLSPASPGPATQSIVWMPESQTSQIQDVQSPGPYSQETIRRYIVQNQEQVQDVAAPYTQGTIRRYIVQNPEAEIQTHPQETIRRYIVQNQEQEIQAHPQETIRRYIVQNQEQEIQTHPQETIRRYIVQNQEQEIQTPPQETVRRYIVQNPEQEIQTYPQETIRRYIVQNPEQEIQTYPQETIRRYIVQNPEQEIQTYPQETVRRYIVQNPEQNYIKGNVGYLPSNNVIYEKTIRRVEMANPEERQVVRGMSVSSINDQVIEQNTQRKVSVQSSEDVISEPHYQQKVSVQNTEHVQRESTQNIEHVQRNAVQRNAVQSIEQIRRSSSSSGPEQLDARYFGELLAELSRKNNDLYTCLLQHVEKIGGRRPSDSEYQSEDVESLIPKGVSELTKQQIRYLLQMRQTSDKSMRLVLSTFSNLREDLGHLQTDLNKLETDKNSLERDLTFKDSQIKEYETILASLREKNRQQQQELKEIQMKLRSSEETMLSFRNAESDKDYRLKELEYAKNALHQENKNLRVQVTETVSSPVLQAKTDEITRHYKEMLESLRAEKDKEIRTLRTQITKFQHDVMSREGSSSDLQMRLLELTSSLEERDSLIKRQQEELFKLRQQRDSSSVTKEVITRQYSNNYPILRLLNDYKDKAPTTGTQTIVIERRQSSKHD
ncbi:protein POF1B isoform X2 [Hyla sarda]|uniref:protein POF1B isoform X2 n=1 Tax=Hyla sarda TaxID=327740 RepID=UPI0024C2CC69|nr:protein POF1B isoform X2 [Hyla sarda]